MAARFWVGGAGTWSSLNTANWSATTGGAGGESVPGAADTVTFDANSGVGTVITDYSPTITTLAINNSAINLTLGANLTCSSSTTLITGTLTLVSYTLSCTVYNSNGSSTRAIAFGTGNITLTGNNVTIWFMQLCTGFSYTGTPTINCTYLGSTGTRIINHFTVSATGITREQAALNFNISAGSDIVTTTTVSTATSFKNLNFTGFTGTLTNLGRLIYGNLTISTVMTVGAGTGVMEFLATLGTQQITTNGQTLDFPILQNGVGGTAELQDNLTLGSSRTLTLTNGTFNSNNKNVTIGSFALGSGIKTLTIGSGTWSVAGANWNANTNVANLTVSASTGTISMTSASAKTFAGGGKTWPTLHQAGAGTLTIQQANTFTNITNTVQPATITFPASTTTTVNSFSVSGTSGNFITLNSSIVGTQATLSDASGVDSVSFCDIKDINATGGAAWVAYTENGNVDSGNNLGWQFIRQVGRYIYTRRKNKRILP